MKQIVTLTACAALLALGCDGTRTDPDAGGIVLMDSGPGGTDAGPMGTDAGPSCAPVQSPAPSPTAVCLASTLTCLMGAGTPEAQQACVMADPAAMACDACILSDLIFICTGSTGGCAQQNGDVVCCANDNCGGTPDEACLTGACAGASDAFVSCINACGMVSNACFMM